MRIARDFLFGTLIVLSLSLHLHGQDQNNSSSEILALTGARIHTQSRAGDLVGTILIQDGKITALAVDVEIPDGARRIDLTGMTITPGWIDSRSSLWLTTPAAREGSTDGRLDILDGVDFTSEQWRDVAAQGVTAVYVQPAATGNLGGRGAVLRVAGGAMGDIVIKKDAALQASIGVTTNASTTERYTQYDRIKKALDAAKAYRKQWEDYEKAKKKKEEEEKKKDAAKKDGEKKGDAEKKDDEKKDDEKQDEKKDDEKKDGEKKEEPKKDDEKKPATSAAAKAAADKKSETKELKKPNKDQAKEFLLLALDKKIPVRFEVHRLDDVQRAMKLAADFKLQVVLDGLSHPAAAKDLLAKQKPAMVLGPVLEVETRPAYAANRRVDSLEHAASRSNRWALATFGQTGPASRFLRLHAAAAVAQGIAAEDVLAAVTRNAALILGVEDRLGQLAVGRTADLTVFAGDPLDASVPVRMTMSQGQIVYQQEVEAVASKGIVDDNGAIPDEMPERYAIRSTRVLASSGEYGAAYVIVADGKIQQVSDAAPGSDTPVFDVGDAVVTPGLVAAATTLGQSAGANEATDPATPEIRVADYLDPHSQSAYQFRKQGVTAVVAIPGSQNVISGRPAVVRVAAAQPLRETDAAMHFTLTSGSRNPERFPSSLSGQVQCIQDALMGKACPTRFKLPGVAAETLARERQRQLKAVTEGRPVMIEATTRAEIGAALRLMESHQLSGSLIAARELGSHAEALAARNIGIVITPLQATDNYQYWADVAEASRRGVPISFGGRTAEYLRSTAAWSVSQGVAPAVARVGLTAAAGRMLGLEQPLGTIAAEADADLVIWNDCPLNLQSKVICVLSSGQRVDLDATH